FPVNYRSTHDCLLSGLGDKLLQVVDQAARAFLASRVAVETAVEIGALLGQDQLRPGAGDRFELDRRERDRDALFIDLHRVAVDDAPVGNDVVVGGVELGDVAGGELALHFLPAADAKLHLPHQLLPLALRPGEPHRLGFRIRPRGEHARRRRLERALDREAAVLQRALAHAARCSFDSAMTIQPTPKRSASMPKLGEKNVFVSGCCTLPPSASALKHCFAFASSGTTIESEKPANWGLPLLCPSEA